MSKDSEQWIAFPDVTEQTDGQITVGYTGLPAGLDADRLQLNTTALRKGVIDFGGYAALTLASYGGNEDQYTIGVGSDSAGNAYGVGSSTVTKAESSRLELVSDKELNEINIRNGSLGVQWNINALNNRIETHEQYDPAIRARQLSREIRKQTVRGVLNHNLKDALLDTPFEQNLISLILDAWTIRLITLPLIDQNYAEAASVIGVRAVVYGTIRSYKAFGKIAFGKQNEEFKDHIVDPLFYTARPLRAMAAAGILSTSKLVRPTPAKSE